MKFLRASYQPLISIAIGAWLIACSSPYQSLKPAFRDPNCIEAFKPNFKNELYSARIDVVGKHLSGLLLFKNVSDTSLHVVFLNEAGVTFFDFEFLPNRRFKVNHIIPLLNKKAIVQTLRRDFELVTMQRIGREKPLSLEMDDELYFGFPSGKETDYVVTDKHCLTLRRIEMGSRKKKTEVTFSAPALPPDSIRVTHFNFNMTFSLKRLVRQ